MSDREHFLAIVVGASKLSGDELRVAKLLVDRLTLGRERYGELRLSTDRRDWLREAADEALDLAVYGAIRAVVVADAVDGVVAQVEAGRAEVRPIPERAPCSEPRRATCDGCVSDSCLPVAPDAALQQVAAPEVEKEEAPATAPVAAPAPAPVAATHKARRHSSGTCLSCGAPVRAKGGRLHCDECREKREADRAKRRMDADKERRLAARAEAEGAEKSDRLCHRCQRPLPASAKPRTAFCGECYSAIAADYQARRRAAAVGAPEPAPAKPAPAEEPKPAQTQPPQSTKRRGPVPGAVGGARGRAGQERFDRVEAEDARLSARVLAARPLRPVTVEQVEEERRNRHAPRHAPSPADAIAPPTKASAVVGARKGGPVLL